MYPPLAPPQEACVESPVKKGLLSELHGEELLLIGLVLLLMSERTQPDILLVMALVYVLFAK
jgi:hypothetical protein